VALLEAVTRTFMLSAAVSESSPISPVRCAQVTGPHLPSALMPCLVW
jgi:hypothetical protein